MNCPMCGVELLQNLCGIIYHPNGAGCEYEYESGYAKWWDHLKREANKKGTEG